MRRLLIGVVVTSVLSTILTVTWMALGPLRSSTPSPQASAQAAPAIASAAPGGTRPEWSTAWAAAPSAANFQRPLGHTVRNVVHTTIGGPHVRIRLSNRFGVAPVRFGHVTIALSAHSGGRRDGTNNPSDGTAVQGTLRDVTFGGRGEATVPPGGDILSDSLALDIPADTDLLVSVWTPVKPVASTYHADAKQLSFVSPDPLDRAGDLAATAFARGATAWFYVTAVEVTGAPGTIVALGDSITDGAKSTAGLNHRWPDLLAARLAANGGPGYGVANAGLAGNRILLDAQYPKYRINSVAGRSAQARFAEDVLERSGARTLVVFAGINDIMQAPRQTDAAQLTGGLTHLATRARAQGLRVVVCTITPWKGYPSYTPALDQVRLRVNTWIRNGGDGTFDAVADFDQALRDQADPLRLNPQFDGGDHLHPNDAGMLALANAVPLDKL
ncbi:SGNH/GDSL hydrolase family protein [Paractinoplanes lichenicola]|uniref:SGNH/GDSL hydrolase family protein n=1 Tax=Paractinoplanes lichenicola TaxID=2802976 RepID=A0ABS1VX94_9ACTN|nr:SGNH/GDSL hydrolase family protein [Actinoplanes lichenicola]MBL7259106.1 SGNH/GDSL hydrolase family protein [Actinoplanes lichenicola]